MGERLASRWSSALHRSNGSADGVALQSSALSAWQGVRLASFRVDLL